MAMERYKRICAKRVQFSEFSTWNPEYMLHAHSLHSPTNAQHVYVSLEKKTELTNI